MDTLTIKNRYKPGSPAYIGYESALAGYQRSMVDTYKFDTKGRRHWYIGYEAGLDYMASRQRALAREAGSIPDQSNPQWGTW